MTAKKKVNGKVDVFIGILDPVLPRALAGSGRGPAGPLSRACPLLCFHRILVSHSQARPVLFVHCLAEVSFLKKGLTCHLAWGTARRSLRL